MESIFQVRHGENLKFIFVDGGDRTHDPKAKRDIA